MRSFRRPGICALILLFALVALTGCKSDPVSQEPKPTPAIASTPDPVSLTDKDDPQSLYHAFVYGYQPRDPGVDPDQWALGLLMQQKQDIRAGLIQTKADISDMVKIPGGETKLGCEKSEVRSVGCLPERSTNIDGFYIDHAPVSVEKYNLCVGQRQCLPIAEIAHIKKSHQPDMPALVSVKQAMRYCYWQGKRLPTEDEWEKAAGGKDGQRYPWGDAVPSASLANICGDRCSFDWADKSWKDGYETIAPIGSFPAGESPFGLTDMAGNIKEWVTPVTALGENETIAKGASWYSGQEELAVYYRQLWRPGVRIDDKGIRCAADLSTVKTAGNNTNDDQAPTTPSDWPDSDFDQSLHGFVYGYIRPDFDSEKDRWQTELVEHQKVDIGWNLPKNIVPNRQAMVRIPKGPAIVGCTKQQQQRVVCTAPNRTVDLDTFYIDKHPVLATDYQKCVVAKMCLPLQKQIEIDHFSEPNLPAVITYKQAQRYCLWVGKRLPNENEWEKAARGTDGRKFAWGDASPTPEHVNICGKDCPMDWAIPNWNDGYATLSPVGSFPLGNSPYGLMDVAGNVKEWVTTKEKNEPYVYFAKGASWYSHKEQIAIYYHQIWQPGVRTDDKGARCVAE
jgi:formylglycine-generating enzyme required for sulfatase activity